MAKNKNTGLGRGLEAIFLENSVDESGSVTMLRLSDIEPNPDQPRREFDHSALEELASSIAANGIIQPIVVRSAGMDGYYQIIAGERRWRAAKMAGLTEVPVVIMEVDDKKAAQVALIENIQREDLNGMEAAKAFKNIMDSHEMTQEELSVALGKSRSLVANTLRLLDLPKETCALVEQGKLTAGHARTLLGLIRKSEIHDTALIVVEKGLSVRQTEELVRKLNRPRIEVEIEDDIDKPIVNYTVELEKRMTALLGSKVRIKGKGKNRTLPISINDDKQLDELVTSLCGDNIFDN